MSAYRNEISSFLRLAAGRMRCAPRWRSGFSFVELMFSITILGIGFIMLAAVFPVAIAQTRLTLDDTAAADAGSSAVQYLSQTLVDTDIPAGDFSIHDLSDMLPGAASRITGNMIGTSDRRFAWVALARRTGGDGMVAQVWAFVVRNRNQTNYRAGRDTQSPQDSNSDLPAPLSPHVVPVMLVRGGPGAPDLIRFEGAAPGVTPAAEGAFLVIRNGDDLSGHILRLGNLSDLSTNTWELDPGYDLRDAPVGETSVTVYLVGRGYADPANPAAGYAGPAQDVAIYTSFISLR